MKFKGKPLPREEMSLYRDVEKIVRQFHANPKAAMHRELLGLYQFGYGHFDEVILCGCSWPAHLMSQTSPEEDRMREEYRASRREKWGDVTSAVGGRYKTH